MENQDDIWMYDDEELCNNLHKIFSGVYPLNVKHNIQVNGPMWCIVSYFSLDLNFVKLTSPSKSLQCLSDWTHKIGAAGLTAVNNYLMEEYNMDEDCQEFADLILEDLWFLWHDNDPAVCIFTISCIFEDN